MKTRLVTLENGETIEVPAHVTDEQVQARAIREGWIANAVPRTEEQLREDFAKRYEVSDNLRKGFVRGATVGASDLVGTEPPKTIAGEVGQLAGAFLSPINKLFPAASARMLAPAKLGETVSKYISSTLGGTLGGLAGGYGLSNESTPSGRLEDAVLTGLTGGALSAGLTGASHAGSALWNRFSPSAEHMMDIALKRSGIKPKDLSSAGQKAPIDLHPSFEGMLTGIASKEPSIVPEVTKKLAARNKVSAANFHKSVNTNVGGIDRTLTKTEEAIADKAQKASNIYEGMKGKQLDLSAEDIYSQLGSNAPKAGKTLKSLETQAIKRLEDQGIKASSIQDVPVLKEIHSELARLTSKGITGKTHHYAALKSDVARLLNKHYPGFAEANEAWAIQAAMKRARDEGTKALNKRPSKVKELLGKYSKEEKEAFRAGMIQDVHDELGVNIPAKFKSDRARRNVRAILPKKKSEALIKTIDRRIADADRYRRAESAIRSGIHAAGKQFTEEPITGSPYNVFYRQAVLQRGPSMKEAKRAASLLTDPSMTTFNALRDYQPFRPISIGAGLGALNP